MNDTKTLNETEITERLVARPCAMCEVTKSIASWDQVLFGTENFVVVPSLGSLIEGWLLIVPRYHCLSAGDLPEGLIGELDGLKLKVAHVLMKHYGQVSFFEHGPAENRRTTGCGVDHAHVHAVPVSSTVLGLAEQYLPSDVSFVPGDLRDCQKAVRSGQDYLYFEPFGEEPKIAIHSTFRSQTFRMAVAAMLGKPDRYDWKTHSELDIVEATLSKLTAEFLRLEDEGLHRNVPA